MDFSEASPTLQTGKHDACLLGILACTLLHSPEPSRIHKLVAACFINACLLSAFSCLDVDYSDEHCHLVSSVITLLSGRFNTELYLYLCNLSNLFTTDFTRLRSKQRCERSRSQRKAKIQSERNVSDKASVNQGKL